MDRELIAIAEPIKSLMDLVPLIQRQGQRAKDNPRDMNFITDLCFVQRKCDEILKAVRSELEKAGEIAEQTGCLVLAMLEEPRYSTDNATVSPNPSIVLGLPRPTDPEYSEFIQQLPPSCLRVHYPTITANCDEALAKGEPLPYKYVQQKSIELKFRVTGKKDL